MSVRRRSMSRVRPRDSLETSLLTNRGKDASLLQHRRGELLPGHRLVARGLRNDGYSNDIRNGDYMRHYEGKPVHPVVSLTYALVPGLTREEQDSSLDIDARAVLDPPLDPEAWETLVNMGGERDARPGGSETAGAFGPFALPEGTERLNVTLTQITLVRPGSPSPTTQVTDRILGTLEVDLSSAAGYWTPA